MSRAAKTVLATSSLVAAISLAASAQQPVGELFASDASVRGSMVMTSGATRVMSGSQVSAGDHVAVLKLTRGGEVRICRGTGVAVSESSTGSPLLFGINSGSLELHYTLKAMADSVVTPDFRIQLPGPGTFHVALGADSKGNTCLKSLEGNTSAVIVQDQMGSGTYQVAPGHSVLFAEGKLENAVESDEACGCPAPNPAPLVVAKVVAPPVAAPEKPAPSPAAVEADTPLVFKGKSSYEEGDRERLRREQVTIATVRVIPLPVTSALAPSGITAVEKKVSKRSVEPKRGFFGSIGSFFSKIFGGR